MNRPLHQKTGFFLILACLGGKVYGGLLPGGSSSGAGVNGYQYNRPGGFVGANNFGGNIRPSTSYGTPGFGGGFGTSPAVFGGQINNGVGFSGAGRPSANYGAPGFGIGNNGFQGVNGGGYQGNGGYNYNDDNGRPRPYSFEYEVRDPPSGNNYGQSESSDGNTVRGEYRVLLPDSRTQIVRYTADDSAGYNADVQYEGQAQYPQGSVPGSGFNGGYNRVNPGGGNFLGVNPGNGGITGYHGGVGVNGNGSPTGFVSGTSSNQYLPPGVDYGK